MKFTEEILKDILVSANKEAQFEGQPQSMRSAWWALEEAATFLRDKLQSRQKGPLPGQASPL